MVRRASARRVPAASFHSGHLPAALTGPVAGTIGGWAPSGGRTSASGRSLVLLGVITGFLGAMLNAWVLLVEILR
ncbi:hypothetical protein [Saccharopolyspora taberi]|uniref:Fluoride ion transporter CrcB n=1 Tax=Saccharopolyspora taberi TaxID=60895 RepID=A0ABN3VEC7_9PSEU